MHRFRPSIQTTAGLIVLGITVGIALFASPLRAEKPPVTAAAFSPRGRFVVIGSQSGMQLRSWPALKRVRAIPTKLENVHDLRFSPNGKRLLAAGGTPGDTGVVEVFTWPDLKLLSATTTGDDVVYSATWTADSNGWITGGLDKHLRLFGFPKGKRTVLSKRIAGHSRGVKAVAVLSGGRTIVSGGNDNSLRVWSLKTGKPIRSFNNHTRPIHDLAVRPTKEKSSLPMVVSVSADRTIRLWQPTIGRMVRFVRLRKAVPLAVRWTGDGGRIVVSCSDGHLRVIDPDTVEVLQDMPAISGWAYSVSLHPNGKEAIVGGSNGAVKRIALRK